MAGMTYYSENTSNIQLDATLLPKLTPPEAPPPPRAPNPHTASAPFQILPVKTGGPSDTSGGDQDPERPLRLPNLPSPSLATVPPPSFINAAAQAVALSFGSTHYAIVGGAACALLGNARTTVDIEVVVMKGETKRARDKLAAQATHFLVDPKTRHTKYLSQRTVDIEISTPPLLFQQDFDETTPTVTMAHERQGAQADAHLECPVSFDSGARKRNQEDDRRRGYHFPSVLVRKQSPVADSQQMPQPQRSFCGLVYYPYPLRRQGFVRARWLGRDHWYADSRVNYILGDSIRLLDPLERTY